MKPIQPQSTVQKDTLSNAPPLNAPLHKNTTSPIRNVSASKPASTEDDKSTNPPISNSSSNHIPFKRSRSISQPLMMTKLTSANNPLAQPRRRSLIADANNTDEDDVIELGSKDDHVTSSSTNTKARSSKPTGGACGKA
jgi:hypothetical protein